MNYAQQAEALSLVGLPRMHAGTHFHLELHKRLGAALANSPLYGSWWIDAAGCLDAPTLLPAGSVRSWSLLNDRYLEQSHVNREEI